MAKKSVTDSAKKKNKKKNSKKTGPNAVAMKNKTPKPQNPFETIWSRRKFDILGKKRKGEQRRVGLARSLALEKRKKTLLKEYEQSGKATVFVDKRIGEGNEGLEEFDKAILRSQRERQLKLKKKSKYDLSDGEEDELEIRDGGQFLGNDDFEDEVQLDEDEDADEIENRKKSRLGLLNPATLENTEQTGSAEEKEYREKSKKEVMEEIMLKSKFFKAQKAKDKEENEQLIDRLDKEFTSMVHSEALVSLTQPDKMNALKALVNKSSSYDESKRKEVASSENKASNRLEEPDFYDKLVSDMALDMRARPSNRTRTAEEIAQEEKERLEELEEERQKRMIARDESSDEEGDGSEDGDGLTKHLKSMSGDDLGDSFSIGEEQNAKLGWIQEMLRKEKGDVENEGTTSTDDSEGDDDEEEEEENDDDDEEEEEDEDEGEEEGSGEYSDGLDKIMAMKDWEQSDDDKLDNDLEEEDEDDDQVERKDKKCKKQEKQLNLSDVKNIEPNDNKYSSKTKDLPYTIEAPKSLDEFTSLVGECSNDHIVEAIKRIRTFNSISIAAENRKKMQVFYGVLLQYFAVLANTKPLNFKLLNLLVKPLMEMSAEVPYFAAICARQRLLHTRTQFTQDVKDTGKSSWPSLKTLFLLRLWSMIFPCSDFRHAVMTPAILLMCEYLMRCPIRSGRDILIGSFLCSMVFSVIKQSQKFCPEALLFLRTLLNSALDEKQGLPENHELNHLLEIKAPKPLLSLKGYVKEINSLEFLELMELPEDSPHFSSDSFRASVLMVVTETLQGFVDIYQGFNSFSEIFVPMIKLLRKLAVQDYIPEKLESKISDIVQAIEKKVDEQHAVRQPLRMRKKKPVPIKMLNPKFEENFVKGRDYDPDRERAEHRKLKKLLKREAKGAARELRKDNSFLFEVKDKEKALVEEERAEKYGKARAFLQEQEHAFKSGQLGKGGKKRRR